MNRKNIYNPFKVLFLSVLISALIMFLLWVLTVYLVNGELQIYGEIKTILSIIVGVYAACKKIVPTSYTQRYANKQDEKSKKILKTAFLIYPVAVYTVLPLGLVLFFYDLIKQNKSPLALSSILKKCLCGSTIVIILIGIFVEILFVEPSIFYNSTLNNSKHYDYNDIEVSSVNGEPFYNKDGKKVTGTIIKKEQDEVYSMISAQNGRAVAATITYKNRVVMKAKKNRSNNTMETYFYYPTGQLLQHKKTTGKIDVVGYPIEEGRVYYKNGQIAQITSTIQEKDGTHGYGQLFNKKGNLIMEFKTGKPPVVNCVSLSGAKRPATKEELKNIFNELEKIEKIVEPDFRCEY